ncbi:MAG: PBP1A family penicillin-binding protein, partial [Blastocatellia bacterium]
VNRRNILASAVAFLALGAAVITFKLYEAYTHYAALLDLELANQSLQRPAGVYAAPRQVSVGRLISIAELKERLLRAGYQEGGEANHFISGSFFPQADTIEVRTNEHARTDDLPELARISFYAKAAGRERITAIEDAATGRKLSAIRLPAELITADLNTKIQSRRFADFAQFPSVLVNAVTAIEDRNFFTHSGLSLRGICRAFIRNQLRGKTREGGSTITQQLIKTQFLTPERTWERKGAEAMMALAIERRLSKEQIFTLYANSVYLGHSGMTTVYGFNQASQIFFGKELSELSLGEAALLAGLAQAPNRYSPYRRPEAAMARRNVVLQAMVNAGSVSAPEAAAARAERLALLPPAKPDESIAPHFIDYVGRELAKERINDEENPHLQIETSLDPDLQQAANQVVRERLAKLDKSFARRAPGARPEAALIALDPHTGEILALVGGRDYTASQLNRVTDAKRQPGSVFKPIVYAAALRHGLSPTTTFTNAPQEFNVDDKSSYRPQNYGRSYSNRPVMLRDGIIRSLNVVVVDAALQVGLGNVAAMAERMGLPRPKPYPSMALGAFEATPLEIAQAYTAFANEGLRVTPFGIKAVKSGSVIIREMTAAKAGVLSRSQAYIITDTLADAIDYGTATRIRQMGYRGPAAGKTGSSRDAWFVGYTPNLLVVVWVGFDDHRDLGLTGSEAAMPIWTDFINRALALRPDLKAAKFAWRTGLVEIDPENGLLANEFCPRRRRVLLPDYLLPTICFEHQAAIVSDPALTSDLQPDSHDQTIF